MKTKLIAVVALLLGASFAPLASADPPAAQAPKSDAEAAHADIQKTLGFLPAFFKAVPDRALPGAWQEMKSLQMNPNTALPGKIKELIGLAVAAQVPCKYCTYAHTEFAKLNGASTEEIGEAVTMAALTRHWSTFANGIQLDEAKFRAEIMAMVERMKKGTVAQPQAQKPMSRPATVSDVKSAQAQIQESFGMVPEFLKRFPDSAIAGAWTEMRDVELDDHTAIAPKYKSLIGLAVSAQIPCRYCIVADTEFAKLAGATDREIAEAVGMASLIRHWSTLLNGLQVDEPTFRRDIDRAVRNARAATKVADKHATHKPREQLGVQRLQPHVASADKMQ